MASRMLVHPTSSYSILEPLGRGFMAPPDVASGQRRLGWERPLCRELLSSEHATLPLLAGYYFYAHACTLLLCHSQAAIVPASTTDWQLEGLILPS
jgi:hypothetical protein